MALAALLAAALAGPRLARADAVGVGVTLLTIHVQTQRDASPENYPRRLDDNGQYVYTPGLEVSYDFDLDEPLWNARQIRVQGGQLSDSIAHRFRYFAVMGRWLLYEGERIDWSLTLGPGIIARKTWRDLPGYNPNNPLRETDHFLPGYEWLILPLGKVELLYRVTPSVELVWSTFPGIPYVIMESVGVRWSFGAGTPTDDVTPPQTPAGSAPPPPPAPAPPPAAPAP